MNIGIKFEKYIQNLYINRGYKNVRHNKTLRKGKYKSQIDVLYSNYFKDYFIECKYRKKGSLVRLDEVAKFVAVLELHGINPNKGEIITNRHLDLRGKIYAKKMDLKVYERDDLIDLERKGWPIWKRYFGKDPNLEKLIRKSYI
jgi:hypothetical protein